jgi:hypothetical protein
MDVRFGIWDVRNLCRSVSLKAVSEELAKYGLDLLGAQEVIWNNGGTDSADLMDHLKLFLSVVVRTL